MGIFEILLKINSESFAQACAAVSSSELMKDKKQFIEILVQLIHVRPFSQQLYADLVKSVDPADLKDALLEKLFDNNSDFISCIKFAKLLLNNGYFSESKMNEFLVKKFDSFQNGGDIPIFSFATFASLILKNNKDLFFGRCSTYYMTFAMTRRNYGFVGYLQQMQSMDEEDLKAHENAKPYGEICNLIASDEVEKLMGKEFNPEATLVPTFFLPTIFLTKIPTYLQFAVFCGANKCAHYLISKGAKIESKDRDGLSLLAYAVAGGNDSMIKELKEKGLTEDESVIKIAEEYKRSTN